MFQKRAAYVKQKKTLGVLFLVEVNGYIFFQNHKYMRSPQIQESMKHAESPRLDQQSRESICSSKQLASLKKSSKILHTHARQSTERRAELQITHKIQCFIQL